MTDPIVLLFSGDLKSTCVLRWFHRQGRSVHALVVNTGQNRDLEETQRYATIAGATAVAVVDVREDLIAHFGHTALWGSVLGQQGDSVWPSLVYPAIAQAHVVFAKKLAGAQIAHTARWEDGEQTCLELAYEALAPGLCVLAPLSDSAFAAQFREPRDYLTYAKNEELLYETEAQDIFHAQESILGTVSWGAHLTREGVVPASCYRITVAPDAAPREGATITLAFNSGKPVSLFDADGNSLTPQDDPVAMMSVLNRLGGQHGMGRADKVCARWKGPSERVLFEAPGLALLDVARADIELITMGPELRKLRDLLAPYVREIIASGRWFTPEMQFIEAALKTAHSSVTGSVTLRLLCGGLFILARTGTQKESKVSRLAPGIASLLTTMRFTSPPETP